MVEMAKGKYKYLYKYLDINGGLLMLKYHNLQFTNATRMNDPFDCHPALIDFSNVPKEKCHGWPPEDISMIESNPYERDRDNAWICSLSKVYDSLLMWSYYNNHKGICIGLNMEKAEKYLSRMIGTTIGPVTLEVQYKDIINKPDYFRDHQFFLHYQLGTKAIEWAHEKEIRLYMLSPSPINPYYVPKEFANKKSIDYKEIRYIPQIGGECFESVYLGVNIDDEKKELAIALAKGINQVVKIYHMEVDPNAFKLIPKLIPR